MPENETARDAIRGVLVFSCRWQSRTPNTSQRPFASAQGEVEGSLDLSKRTSAFWDAEKCVSPALRSTLVPAVAI